jgi:hypothetical protein
MNAPTIGDRVRGEKSKSAKCQAESDFIESWGKSLSERSSQEGRQDARADGSWSKSINLVT